MVLWFRRLFPSAAAPAAPQQAAAPQRSAGSTTTSLRYPPADQGLPLLSVAEIMAANHDLITRLRLHAAMADPLFTTRFLEPIERLAHHINVLPATATSLFAGEMGLFRAALESGFFAFQAADGRIFTGDEGVERRHALEGRWRYLCFLAGLFYPLGKSLELAVVTAPGGQVWKRHFTGITDWAAEVGTDRLFVSWASEEDENEIGPANAGLILLPKVVGPDNLQLLESGAADLVASLYELAAGAAGTSRIAHQVVTTCWERIARREAARRPQAFGRLFSGTHLGPYLVGAVRALVDAGTWVPNKSVLKADRDGVYLQWPEAAADLIRYGAAQGYQGWPHDAPTLAALLRAASIVRSDGSDFGTVEIVDENGEIQEALKIAEPLSVLEDFDPSAYQASAAKTLQAVLQADPLAKSEGSVTKAPAASPAAPTPATVPTPPATAADAAPAASEALDKESAEDSQPQSGSQEPATPAMPMAEPVEAAAAPLKEAPEVRFADLVPEDIRAQIGNSLQVELLGKVVKAWRDKGDGNTSMRRTDQGAAVALDFLTTIIRDVAAWVDAMARAGLIYSPPSTPGLRVQKIAIPEGRNKVNAVVLSGLACKRLGL